MCVVDGDEMKLALGEWCTFLLFCWLRLAVNWGGHCSRGKETNLAMDEWCVFLRLV